MTGLTVVDPNEARVVQFFGRYIGSVSEPGFHFVVPLSTRRAITLRVRNFETQRLKVNDADGNPVFLRDIWPSPADVQSTIDGAIDGVTDCATFGAAGVATAR